MERRKFARVNVSNLVAQERNEDYIYNIHLINLSEEGFLVRGRTVNLHQDPVSYISLNIVGGPKLSNVPARIVWEGKDKNGILMAYHMLGIDEKTRLSLQKYLLGRRQKSESFKDNVFSIEYIAN